jgi:hypothetical protein
MGRRGVTVVGPHDVARRYWEPRTRPARLWMRSRSVDWSYAVIAIVGAASFALVVTDCVASWFGDRVLITPRLLSPLSFWAILPGWLVLMASGFLLRDVFFRRRARPRWPRPRASKRTVALAFGAVIVVAFMIGNSAHGKKGSARVLSGPVYQISSEVDDDGGWATVTQSQYQHFEARLVRGESEIAMFGAIEVGVCAVLLRWRRKGYPLPSGEVSRAAT